MPERFTVATDGACQGNPGPAGWGWVGEDGTWESGSYCHATNNVGELMGLLRAVEAHRDVPLRIEADSQYAINVATTWGPGWRENGWVNGSGRPVKNLDLVRLLVAAVEDHPDVEIVWVKGHAGHRLNEWADNRATTAAERGRTGEESIEGTDHGDEPIDVSVDPPKTQADQAGPASKRRGAFLNLTALGVKINRSAIDAGRALDAAGLRDPETKLPTSAGRGFAKVIEKPKYTQVLWHPDVIARLG